MSDNHASGTSAWDWLKIGLIAVGAVLAYSTFTQNGWDCWTDYCKARRSNQTTELNTRLPKDINPTGSYVTPPAPADNGIVKAGYRGGHRPHATRRDPKFDYFMQRCIEQIGVRKRQDPSVEVRVEGGPGRRSTCYVGSTFSEEGYVSPD